MAPTGFPYGLGTTVDKVMAEIRGNNDLERLCIILYEGVPIGEINYRIAEESHVKW